MCAEPAEYAAGSGNARYVVNRAIGYVESVNVVPAVRGSPDRQRGAVNLAGIIRKDVAPAATDIHGLPQFAFVGHRADHPKALCLGVEFAERPLFQYFATLFRGHIRLTYQVAPFF